MRLRTTLLTASAAVLALSAPAFAGDHQGAEITYPETRADTVVETIFGNEVADPYRWLEQDVRNSEEVAAWVKAQSEFTAAYLAELPGREAYEARIKELYDYERFGIPVEKGGKYFYTRNDGLQNQNVLYVRDGLNGEPRVLIDPNEWAEDGATALSGWSVTEDGSKLLYGIQDGGSDWRTARVLDVATGEVLEDKVEWIKFSGLEWAKDGSGFYYSRFPVTAEGDTFQALNTNQKVYFHKLGTPQSEDVVLYETPDRAELNNFAEISDDGRYLINYSSSGTDDRYEVSLIDLQSEKRGAMTLFPDFKHSYGYIGNVGPEFYFITNEQAPLQQVIMVNVNEPPHIRTVIIPERDAKLDSVSMAGGKLVAEYLVDAKSEVTIYNLDGSKVRDVALPSIGSAGGFDGDADDTEVFYFFSSFNRPTTIYKYDLDSGTSEVWEQPEVAFNPDDYVVEQKFYNSKDGTKVPMFLVRRADIAASGEAVPTLLYGYGGFNISITPGFSPSRIAWLDAGGAYVLANIRGGGEYGKAWHDGGRRQNKQNVFDDFIAAGEYLKATGITTKDGLAIEGRSNGGLLVGAVVNQRPDLVDAAHPAVGVMDMLRFDRFTAGRYWVDDYGYPDREKDFNLLLTYSPYHNVQDGTEYPAVLTTTADTDDRVVPGHSFKYAAALQAADLGGKPQLIRIETRAGHGSGKPTDKAIEEAADVGAFLAYHTGLDLTRMGK
ncbi:prolyl oligopeptidase family serine peptidase [Pontixanthobacter aestiaquae]|uniref:prolyl oligopeptidase n=1 Tax=Pontixanthobacter aestiaquae TaxID=1509367 RepID=A0A844Z7R2_9SPHN|nr:prolyl oligopeptidase family serine peptidase [Pontixanthobacter aestiaquae]MDN3645055.1 prolyl oligopeptidase family serine peptidase [Pontixanthobacter aestiaquae]MXO83945.1 prolyl oligopeptidase family serine peptidase [Pontixanthobacter aestiaquae]